MEINKLKKFANEARTRLKSGVEAKIRSLGFDKNGHIPEEAMPKLMQGGTLWQGGFYTERFYHSWMALYERMARKGMQETCEEAAYTWFNRLVAIRILQKNGLCEPVIEFVDEVRTPRIVDDARRGRLPRMLEAERKRLLELLEDDTKTTEQFALLMVAWCHQNPLMQACFGRMQDYTELMLPVNILSEGGFVDMLNHTDFIAEEDYRSPELIGWLYQFYISERKDEVFAKKGKFEADEIPAATQIFTPNWIVKYMVQNTLGRIYWDNNPYAEEAKRKWAYWVEGEPTPEECRYRYAELTDLRVADLACGSGHILNECFDLLYELYISEGYGRKEAVENIFRCNLRGVDIDTRAKQLALFALLLKACQKDASFVDAKVLPQVLDMPQPWNEGSYGSLDKALKVFFNGLENDKMLAEMQKAFSLLSDAESLGSIMKFDLSETTLSAISQAMDYWKAQPLLPESVTALLPALELIKVLTEKYAVLVMNPPYMGGGNMNPVLSAYVKKHYEAGKGDLATVFVEMMPQRLEKHGRYGFIIPPSWMFLSTFENLRKGILDSQSIDSVLHLSRGVFGADFGASAAVIAKSQNPAACGTYFRLVERTFQEFDQKHLRMLFEQTLADHDFKYNFKEYTKEVESLPYSEVGNRIYYPHVLQQNFKKIPGSPMGYWVSEKMIDVINNAFPIDDDFACREGIHTTDNKKYVRLWYEVINSNIVRNCHNYVDVDENGTWVPYNKGGGFRRWYGLNECVVAFDKKHRDEMASLPFHVRPSQDLYFKEGGTWSAISSGKFSIRYYPVGYLFDSGGHVAVGVGIKKLIGYLNSNAFDLIAKVTMPTINFKCGVVKMLPNLSASINEKIVDANISISKQDWDAHETSWDFQQNELVAIDEEAYIRIYQEYGAFYGVQVDLATPDLDSLEWRYEVYKTKWETKFLQLHRNEEELNRQFIEIYDLADELTPDVPLEEVTILQQGEISIEKSPSE